MKHRHGEINVSPMSNTSLVVQSAGITQFATFCGAKLGIKKAIIETPSATLGLQVEKIFQNGYMCKAFNIRFCSQMKTNTFAKAHKNYFKSGYIILGTSGGL